MRSKIKYAFLIIALFTCKAVFAAPVYGEENTNKTTLSVGYTQAAIKGFGSLHGENFRVQYEPDGPVGLMASFTVLNSDWRTHLPGMKRKNGLAPKKTGSGTKYFSTMFGPTIRLNEYLSVYALAGISNTKVGNTYSERSNRYRPRNTATNINRFAYGAGMSANITNQWSIYIGYEGSSVKHEGTFHPVNAVMVGAGYRF